MLKEKSSNSLWGRQGEQNNPPKFLSAPMTSVNFQALRVQYKACEMPLQKIVWRFKIETLLPHIFNA